MLVTLSPITYSFTCEPNILCIFDVSVYSLLTISFELSVTDVREEHLEKASSPMLVTLLPIVTEVREKQ